MEKRSITPASVERTLLAYERRFGMSSTAFYEAHYADRSGQVVDVLAGIPRRHRYAGPRLAARLSA